jgi:penicillin G amidase
VLRFIKIIAVIGLAAVLTVTSLLVIGARTSGPASTEDVAGLTGVARIAWFETGERPPRIEAESEADAFRALGFAQTQAMTWRLLLWRQAARGRLAEWFGTAALPADRVARQLALVRGAAQALPDLSPQDRAMIEAFVDGVNAGLSTERVRNDARSTLIGVQVEPFNLSDVLAIERLVAWLSRPVAPPEASERWPEMMAFRAGDTRLRTFLDADGLHLSRLWTFADSSSSRLVASYVTGTMVRPLFFDAEVVVDGLARTGVFLPGTPFPIAGAVRQTDDATPVRAWAVYPASGRDWREAGSQPPTRRTERFGIAGGQESVLIVTESPEGALFRSPIQSRVLPPRPRLALPDTSVRADTSGTDAERNAAAARRSAAIRQAQRADSLWRADSARLAAPRSLVLAWNGFPNRSDAAAWLNLWRGTAPTFQLFTGAFVTSAGGAGARAHRRGLLISDSVYAAPLLARLDSFSLLPDFPASDVTSVWARDLNRRLVADLDTARLRRPIEREAYTYLRNWTGTFEETSVAATLFTHWLDAESRLNALPDSALAADTTFFSGLRRTRAFQTTLDTLARRFGTDLRRWRWGRAVPHLRRFAPYGVTGLDLPARRRYTSLERPEGGHPSALAYGPESPADPVTTYTLDVSLRPEGAIRLRRLDFDPDRFLARFRLPFSTDPVTVAPQAPIATTRLTPR